MNRKIKKLAMAAASTALILCLLFTGCAEEARSVVDADINKDGELVLTYSDGSEDNLGTVVGKDGQDGQDGQDGANGTDGSVTVTGSTDALILAAAKGLRSAVSIVCEFTQTTVGYRPSTSTYSSCGSGVIYRYDSSTGEAFIITNYHVVYDSGSKTGVSENITIYLYGSENYGQGIQAEYVGGSMNYDIAVLYVPANETLANADVAAVKVADSNEIAVGSTAIAVGNPESLGLSVSYGIVSVDSEYIDMTAADNITSVSFRVMRIDAAVNSGNSGGGLYNQAGELIGIVNAKIASSDVENIGYAIPSTLACAVADNIIDYCYGTDCQTVQRGILGISVITSDSCMKYDSATGYIFIEETVQVYEVTKGGLADGVLEPGDILTAISVNEEQIQITRQYHVIDMMLNVRAGDVIKLTVERNGEVMEVEMTMTEAYITSS